MRKALFLLLFFLGAYAFYHSQRGKKVEARAVARIAEKAKAAIQEEATKEKIDTLKNQWKELAKRAQEKVRHSPKTIPAKTHLTQLVVSEKEFEKQLQSMIEKPITVKLLPHEVWVSTHMSLLGASVPVQASFRLVLEGGEIALKVESLSIYRRKMAKEVTSDFAQALEEIRWSVPQGWTVERVEIHRGAIVLYGIFRN